MKDLCSALNGYCMQNTAVRVRNRRKEEKKYNGLSMLAIELDSRYWLLLLPTTYRPGQVLLFWSGRSFEFIIGGV